MSRIPPSRRHFLKTGAAGLLVAGMTRSIPSLRAEGANDDLRIAVIGTGGRGSGHVSDLLGKKGVRVVAICDADQGRVDENLKRVEKAGQKATGYQDFRKVMENGEVDGVVIATPNHSHTLISLWAIAADKHVYVEKPVSHNVFEGRILVEAAAKRPKLMVQHGMQRRSDGGWIDAHKQLQEGKLGKIKVSRGFNYKPRSSIGQVAEAQTPPSSVDYNLWCGPREVAPLMRKKLHYDWHWQWAYGNGDIGNQGPHQTDVARWMIDQMKLPPRTMSLGGRFGYEDDGETANTQVAVFDYAPVRVLFDNRGLPRKGLDFKGGMDAFRKVVQIGNVVDCENGYVAENSAYDWEGKKTLRFGLEGGGGHMQNWLDSIRAGKQDNQNLAIIQGHLSGAMAHLANLSYRLGKSMNQGEIMERVKADADALELFESIKEHLGQNGIDLAKTPAQVGPWISLDPDTEAFTGEFATEATKLDQETYRDEFKLPVIS
jgi:predicted dehydrogenase